MPGADRASARAHEQLPAALNHIHADVVDERTRHLLRTAHADVIPGIRTATATAVRHQQVIPAIVVDHDGGFRIDRDITRHLIGWSRFPVFGITISTSRMYPK